MLRFLQLTTRYLHKPVPRAQHAPIQLPIHELPIHEFPTHELPIHALPLLVPHIPLDYLPPHHLHLNLLIHLSKSLKPADVPLHPLLQLYFAQVLLLLPIAPPNELLLTPTTVKPLQLARSHPLCLQ